MKSYLEQDIQYLIDNLGILDEFKGKTILITGATGLIGSFAVKLLCEYSKQCSADLKVYAIVRDRDKAKLMLKKYITSELLVIKVGDINNSICITEPIDYIIHGASITSSRYFVEKPVETINTIVNGTNNVLSFAKYKKVKRMVFLSSLEVYGVPDDKYQVKENYVGYIDFSNIRSSYSEGKRLAECLCYSFAKEYDLNISAARLAQTFGPGVDYNDNRVFAQFARSVINKENITLNTSGLTYRNYCYLRDAVAGIIYILLRGENCESYNIANKNTGISIADMAQLMCSSPKLGNGNISVIFNHPEELNKFGYNPEMKIELLTDKLEHLGWKAEVGLEEMFIRMIGDMKKK